MKNYIRIERKRNNLLYTHISTHLKNSLSHILLSLTNITFRKAFVWLKETEGKEREIEE